MTARVTFSLRMRSAYVLMLLTPTFASSAKNTKIYRQREGQMAATKAIFCATSQGPVHRGRASTICSERACGS